MVSFSPVFERESIEIDRRCYWISLLCSVQYVGCVKSAGSKERQRTQLKKEKNHFFSDLMRGIIFFPDINNNGKKYNSASEICHH